MGDKQHAMRGSTGCTQTCACLTALGKMTATRSARPVPSLTIHCYPPSNTLNSPHSLPCPADSLLHNPPSHVIPCLTWTYMNKVQWSDFVGTSNEWITISCEVVSPMPCSSTRDRHTLTYLQYGSLNTGKPCCYHGCSRRAHLRPNMNFELNTELWGSMVSLLHPITTKLSLSRPLLKVEA